MLSKFVLILGLSCLALSAQAFEVTDSVGKVHRLADYKGKWLLVNFWATWCPPCLEEIPDLVALHDNKKNNLAVIGIAMSSGDHAEVLDFARQRKITYPIVMGTPRIASQIGAADQLPATYLYNPDGKAVAYNVGALTRKAVETYIARNGGPGGKAR